MADTISKVYLEWSEIHELVNILCKKIITEYPTIDSVMGLPRGGMIPAVMVSQSRSHQVLYLMFLPYHLYHLLLKYFCQGEAQKVNLIHGKSLRRVSFLP